VRDQQRSHAESLAADAERRAVAVEEVLRLHQQEGGSLQTALQEATARAQVASHPPLYSPTLSARSANPAHSTHSTHSTHCTASTTPTNSTTGIGLTYLQPWPVYPHRGRAGRVCYGVL
jgi:hypothetical protein